jgi:hypothetical protein
MDAEIARVVFGATVVLVDPTLGTYEMELPGTPYRRAVPHYSGNVFPAFQVIDVLRSRGYGVTLSDVRAGFWTVEIDRDTWRGSEVWTGETAALAICRAALAAVLTTPTPA